MLATHPLALDQNLPASERALAPSLSFFLAGHQSDDRYGLLRIRIPSMNTPIALDETIDPQRWMTPTETRGSSSSS